MTTVPASTRRRCRGPGAVWVSRPCENGPRRSDLIHVSLRTGTRTVTLRVHDDGPGFDPAALPRTRRGMGLATMRERAEEIRSDPCVLAYRDEDGDAACA